MFLRRIIPIFSVWGDTWSDIWGDIKKRNEAVRSYIWRDKIALFRVLSMAILA